MNIKKNKVRFVVTHDKSINLIDMKYVSGYSNNSYLVFRRE